MNVTFAQIAKDLVDQPGIGMFIWFCFVTFVAAFIFFLWALKSGQMKDIEDIKFDMFDEGEVRNV